MFRYQKTLSGGSRKKERGGCGCLSLILGLVLIGSVSALFQSSTPEEESPAAPPGPAAAVALPKPNVPPVSSVAPTPEVTPPAMVVPLELEPGGMATVKGNAQFLLDEGIQSIAAGEVVQIESLTEKEAVVIYKGTKGKVVRLRLQPLEQ